MASTPSASMANVGAIAQVATGTEQEMQVTRLGALRMTFLEQPGYELGRANRSFVGGMSLVAGGVVPVVDIPTTTAPVILFNSNASGGKNYHIKQVSIFYASGTAGADGAAIFGGVSPSVLATALTANGTNIKTQSTRGYGVVSGYIDVSKTVASGIAWAVLSASTYVAAATVTGLAMTVDVRHLGFVVPPLFAFGFGALGDTGTTAKYGFSIMWDELDGDLP